MTICPRADLPGPQSMRCSGEDAIRRIHGDVGKRQTTGNSRVNCWGLTLCLLSASFASMQDSSPPNWVDYFSVHRVDAILARDHCFVTFTVRTVDHIEITVADLGKAVAFWRDTLRFELSEQVQLSGERAAAVSDVEDANLSIAVLLAPNGQRIELVQYHRPQDRALPRPCPSDVASVRLALIVDDLDAVLDDVARAGWVVTGGQIARSGPRAGARVAFANDGDGMTIQFVQLPDGPAVDDEARTIYRTMVKESAAKAAARISPARAAGRPADGAGKF